MKLTNPRCLDVAGILTYFAFLLILSVWAVGWLTVSGVVGSILKVPPKVSIAAGLILGPLGVLYVLFTGFSSIDWKANRKRASNSFVPNSPNHEDPFQ